MRINKDSQKTPNLRFKGFTDDWEQRKLDTIGNTFTGLTGKTKEDFGHGEAKYIPYTNIFNNSITDVDQLESIEIDKKQNSVVYGDILFTTSSETPEEVGMSSVWMHEKENVYLNSFCFGFRPIEKHHPLYLAYLLRSPNMRKKFTLLAQGISRYNISKNKVLELTIPLPVISEQIKVGNTLKSLDDIITLHQRKLDQLIQLKETLLQQMFPGKGETVPKLRFAGFEGEWEERKLGDLLNKNAEKNKDLSVINVESVSNKTGFTKQTEQFEDYSVASADLSNYYVIRECQFAYNPSRINVGSIAYKDLGDDKAVVSPLYVSFSTKKGLHDGFIWNWFKTPLFDAQRQRLSEGGVRDTLSFHQLSEMDIIFPEYLEQEKISDVFKQLDNTITLQQRKLDQLNNMKQVLLQNMFI